MRKRGRAARSEPAECPICFEAFEARGARTEAKPFQCGHGVCKTCNTKMNSEQDNRCPQCRAPRIGFTVAQAEPDPSRNYAPTFAETLAELGVAMDVDVLRNALAQPGPGLASGSAGGYGGLAGLEPRGPHTTMFFPVQPPVSLASRVQALPPVHEQVENVVQQVMAALQANGQTTRVPANLLRAAMHSSSAHTFLEFGSHAGFSTPPYQSTDEAIRALLDLPTVSLLQWNQRHRFASGSGRRPPEH